MPEFCRQVVVNNELAPHNAVRLSVTAALEASRFPQLAHLLLERGNDRVEKLLFIRQLLLLRDLQSFVSPLKVDQLRREPGDRIAQHGIEWRTKPRIESAFKTQE